MILKTMLVLGLGLIAGVLGVVLSDSFSADSGSPVQVSNSSSSSIRVGYLVFHDMRNNRDFIVQCSSITLDPRYLETMTMLDYELISEGC